MDSDHKKYDNPEPKEETKSKAIAYLIGALAVAVVLYLVATGEVQIWS